MSEQNQFFIGLLPHKIMQPSLQFLFMIQRRINWIFGKGKNIIQYVTLADVIQYEPHHISLRVLMQLHSTATERQNNRCFKVLFIAGSQNISTGIRLPQPHFNERFFFQGKRVFFGENIRAL